ncbi:MAG TPA: Gfo/Idh/MocA family oxidoreductase, partial [Vicinamibacterales bacterium]|nr:Gfo/Idh/MocA family oxidoreductase [Vicinamibacterales bacterium]
MTDCRFGRREFLGGVMGAATWGSSMKLSDAPVVHHETPDAGGAPPAPRSAPRIRFAVIGLNHGHIYGQTEAVLRGGGELVAVYAKEPDLLAAYQKQFPQAKTARSEQEILEDTSLQLVVSAAIPDERAPLGIRVMKHGKDYMSDKPGITTLEQLAEVRRVQAETRRIYSIMYSERLENRATVRAGELVKAGAIGKVVQTIGLGPHRINPKSRPAWFWDRMRYGGIL